MSDVDYTKKSIRKTLELAKIAGNNTIYCHSCMQLIPNLNLRQLGRDFGEYLYTEVDAEFYYGLSAYIEEKS